MTTIQVRQALATRISALLAALATGKSGLPKEPRPYQVEAIAAFHAWLMSDDPSNRAYITHATGLGKTVFISAMVRYCIGLRCLIVVPSKLLVSQTAQVVQSFTGGIIGHLSSLGEISNTAGDVIAVRGTDFSDVVVATDESLIRNAGKIATEFAPHLLIWDECHSAYTRRAKESLDCFNQSVILGMSATPDYLVVENRKDHIPVAMENGQTLYVHRDRMASTHFNKEIHALHLTWGIKNGWLAPMAWGHIDFEVDLDSVPLEQTPVGLDYNQGALYDAMADHWSLMIETVVSVTKRNDPFLVSGRRAYALCLRTREAQDLADALNGADVPAACITGKTKDAERNRLLQAYRHRDISFLTSVMVLREGWDAPENEVCWMLRPTQSRVLYVQGMGRVLRTSETNPDKVALVIDPLFQGNRHAPLSAPKLFGTPGKEYASGDLLIPGKWRGTRGQQSSPYLPKGVKPKLVIITAPTNTPAMVFYETIEEASMSARKLGFTNLLDYQGGCSQDNRLPRDPKFVYGKEAWEEVGGWPGFLGTGAVRRRHKHRCYPTIQEASQAAQALEFKTFKEYESGYLQDPRLPANPIQFYGKDRWTEIGKIRGFLGQAVTYRTVEEAAVGARACGFKTSTEYLSGHKRDPRLPHRPDTHYRKEDWDRIGGWPGFLATSVKRPFYETIEDASVATQKTDILSSTQYARRYKEDPLLPSLPQQYYGDSQWKKIGGWPGFLGKKKE